jgi:hypothetical protein
MRATIPKPGEQFGSWVVLSEVPPSVRPSGKKDRQVLARCSCGRKKIVRYSALRNNRLRQCKSCASTKHGLSHTPEYQAWYQMVRRCNDPRDKRFYDYGGRGVTVCSRWDPSKGGCFENFYTDMGPRPTPAHQLDKEAIDIGAIVYGPESTRWSLPKDNCNRRRTSRFLQFNGEILTVSQWARRIGLTAGGISYRLRSGWSIEKALTVSTRDQLRRAHRYQ